MGQAVSPSLRSAGTPTNLASVTAALGRWAARAPERTAYVFLADGEEEQDRLTYAALDTRARAIAAALGRAVMPGERVLLLYPPGLDFIAAFFGCLYAGLIAVPAYPPRSPRMMPRLLSLLADARPAVALASGASLTRVRGWLERTPEAAALSWLATDGLEPAPAGWEPAAPESDDIAFLQYTSGSTSTPKGVMVSHGNLLHNQEMIRRAFGQDEDSVIVGWLPLYHDMGLIGNVLQPLYVGARCVLMSPHSFLQRPQRWLEAISRHGATTSGGPNFAYDLCARKVSPADLAGLDLSRWNVAFNGAEPVRPETLERFATTFAPAGFRREAFYPCYGLAEGTLFAAGGLCGRAPEVRAFEASALEQNRAVPVEAGPAPARRLVGCGHAWMEQEIAVVDPETGERCASGQVGEIWISGPSVARGYWGRAEETQRTFGAELPGSGRPFLRTGDLGVISEGELFVTGRLKDLIILRGRNLYPQDIELTVEASHPALRAGCAAAFPVEVAGEERLVVVQEIERRQQDHVDVEAVAEAIRRAVAEEHEARVHEVVLLEAGAIPKTSSGKIQRHACRAGYLAGSLALVGRSTAPGPTFGEEGAPALDRGALLALPPEDRQAAVEAFLTGRIARLTGLGGAPGELAAGRSLASLGLDSLMVVELRNALAAGLGIEIPMTALFQDSGGIAELAGAVLAGLHGTAEEDTAEAPAPGRERPLTWGQKGLWLLDRMAPDCGVCNVGGAARVRSPLDSGALRRALVRLARRHPALRTVFGSRGEEPWQRVEADLAPGFAVRDASGWSSAELEERLLAEIYRPFDLAHGPLIRAAVWTLAPGEAVLSLSVHHLIADLWSLVVVLRDLGALYEEESGGAAAELPRLALSPADGFRRQERALSGERGERLRSYWSEKLAGPLPVVELPADRLRPPVPSHAGSSVGFRVPGGVADRLRELARQGDATLYTVLLGAFLALIHRQTGQEDLVIGSPTSGRTIPGCEPLVGYLVNPVALRAGVDGDAPFAALLSRVREAVLGALDHQEYPFTLLAERREGPRDASRSPIFQLAFVFQKPHLPELAGLGAFALGEGGGEVRCGGLRLESIGLPQARVQFDLTLVIAEREAGLGAAFQYATDLFDGATGARLASQMGILLEGIAAGPHLAIGDLPLLSATEERQLLVEWNRTGVDGPRGLCLHELFEAQVERTPEAVAVICGEERLSYLELEERANRLAHHLRSMGVGPEARVGVCMERSAELIAALLGVLKAGGAYVPLDPAYPGERIAFMVEDSGARPVLTRELLEREREALAAASAERPRRAALPEHLAYVIYTSGSTGRPKGVAIEHAAPVELALWARGLFGPEALSRVLASTSVCFDLSVFEIFVPLCWGGAVVLVDNALGLPAAPAAGEVTLINTVPSVLTELLRMGALPASAATVNLAGEPLPRALARQAYAVPSVRRLFNLYGPSEDTTYSTFALVGAEEPGAPAIGRPIANTRAHVLDRRLRPVPVGVPGELYLGGRGLARGYQGRPELTAERFIPDPFASLAGEPGARLYKTGDRVRRMPDGALDFQGRLDHQVKVRGVRIELGEVEAALCEHPGVRQAAAAVGRDGLLAAYLVPRSGGGLAWPELREALRRRLPEALVPSLAMVLDALPLTPGGKVDRKALPEPEMAARRERTAPRTPLEERLAAIWSDLLGVGEIGIEESFFDLGGHSLLALRVISRVREELGVELALRTVFERPTVAALAAALEEPGVDGKGAAPPAPPLRPVPRDGGLPLSFAQERLWFLHELMPESVAYNIPAALRLSGRLDPGALRRTFEEIALRQESLRTTFRLADGRPVQWITPAGPWPLPVVDLAALGPEEREREARHRAAEEAALPFDLAAGPLVRTMLLRLSPEEHILALTAHHAVFDGWSLGILSREMGGLYPVLAQGGDGRGLLPGLSVQYADFAVWQRRWLADGELDRQLAWWRQRLAGAPALLELPADRPRPKTATGRGGTRSSRLAPDLTAALHTLGRGRGATLFMTLFAGWAALLNRYTGEADLVVGTPVANRPRAVLEDLIGLFVNSLPLRTDLDGDPAFPELLDRVREGLLGAQAHQDLPFEKLVEALAPRRSTAHTPLFQVLFVLQNAPFTALELPGLILSPVEIEGRTAQLDLSLSLAESGPEIAATLEFNRDLFDASTADRLLGHLEILLAGAVDAPQRPLTDLPLLTAAERRQLEAEAGGAGGAPPGESRLDRLFDEQAARTPEAVALVCDDMALTYAELRERSDRLARHLAGIAPEAPLGVCLESSPELVVSLLAVWKAGGAYLPLDPAYPPERLAFMVEDAGVPAVLTSGQRPVLPWAGDARVVVVTGGGPAGELPPSRGHASPGTLAWIIYTSGSTGRPKGVAVEHGAAADHLRNVVAAWGLGGGDRVLQLSSPSFDMSLEEIVAPLLCGATVVLRGTDPWEPSRLLDRADALGLTVLNLPTAYWQQWIRECEQGGAAGRLPLRLVVVGGEAVPAEAARRWRRTPLGGVRLLNGYGPTEAVISASFHAADAAEAAPDGSVPIGRPLPGRSGWVLDRRGAPLPPGVPGELHLGGRALARGYPGRPGLTAERFVPDPFSAVPGSRLYRTGDLVRRLPAGPLSFLGRIDRQVKVRGFRIEPGEVEAALRAHPAVRDAAVVVRGEGEARILAAFVVPAAVPLQELRAFLRGRLPEHLVPSRFEALDALPLTPAGKVDRAALARRHPEPEARAGAAEPGRPPTPVEEVLAGIWAEVLGRGQVGLEEDFFELGGHSLLATQVASRLRACFGVELPLQTLFAAPTVARLAAAVEAALRCAAGMAASEPPLVPAAPALRSQGLPLSFAQERLWFLDRLEPESPVYNISAAVLLEGDLQGEALRQALEWIVARHEALRTTFREVDGRPVQVAAPALAVLLPAVDLGGLPETDRGEEVLRLTEEEALRPFDLEAGPLLRAVLVRCARGEHRLLLTLHHIISDGWSLGVLVREVNAAYGAAVEARRPQLPALPVQYADYAVWQRSWLTGEALAAHLSWWRERLRGAPAALDLPADRPRPAVADRRGASSSRALPQRLWGAVESLARRAGATPFLVVLTALEALLARYSGADDLTVGTPAAGRTRRETEDLIGFFVNTLVLRAELAGAPSFQDLLLRARESMLGAHAHQDLPFERLVEELAPERELGRTPLFQVMLAFGNMPMPPLELPGLRLSLVESEARTSKFDLTVSFAPRQDGALLHLSYRTDLFERTTAERMADHLTVLLAEAVADPAARLSDLQLLTAAEREQLAHEAEEARRGAPAAPGTVPELFRDVAARVPEAEAVTGEGLSVTFRELAARCARLAGLLRRLGAGPEVPVALCAEPSSGLVAGLLAILQAGGVWVPLDPSHPDERLAWMLEDSGAPLLLVEESLAGRFTGARARRILLDGPEAGSPAPLALPAIPPEGAAYEGAAYVIYTSGSTGRPKGTVISHQSLAGYLTWFNERFAAVGARPMPAIASPGFDASLKQLLAPLLRGDPVWIVPPGTASRPDDLLGELARRDAVALNCVPSLWRILLDRIEAAPEAGRSLRHLLLGGEAFDTGLVERTLRALPGIEVWNLYGPTEATANASCARVSGGEAGIGRGIAGAALHAVDPHLQLLPAGVPGELAIAGPGLARGYLGLPALTAERFVPNPFAAAPGERLYRTGDRARWRPGLRVELLGRLDRQVKVRGFRVEPGEVEAVLATHPQVKEAAVIGLPQGPQEMRLAAYLAVGRSARPAPEDVRRFVAERLPAAMVPTAWVLLDRLPRTPAGKLDARALPEPDLRAGGEGGSTAPQRPAEELVAAIFADLLRVERVGAADGFFALGGHSLLATQVISRLRSVFDVELPLRTLFERPGVAELAAAVEEARRGGPGRAAPPLVPVARGGNLPLSFAQERLWFLDQLEPGSTAYNIPAAFTLSGSLDAQALTAAYGEILRRHEALRTTFTAVDGQPVQRISPPAAVSVAVIDLAGLPLEDRQAAAARLAADDARRGFDLARGPLVRLTLLRLGRDEHLAVLGMHHIVADAWSMRVLVRELTSLYTAFVTGAASPLPELPLQYADYAVWQRDWLRGEALEAELAFWREALAGAPGVLELPADRPRPPAPSGRGASRTVRLSPALTSALTAFSRREGLTLFMTLLAAWNALLFRASEQTDLVVGVPIANRNRLETEGLIGFFTNTLALRSRPAAGTGFLDLARAVRETALKAYSHQDLPFERLVEELAPERSLAHTPLFQVLFSLQNVPAGEIALPGLALAPWNLAQETAKFDLSLLLAEAGDELHATLELSADLFDAVTAHRLLERFRTALWGAVADPGRSLAELPLLPLSERHQILYEWNEAPAGEGPPCVHHLVAAQARRTPEAIAVLPAGGTELSYGDLDRLADRLARRLRELGVRPDDCVGVCLERSWEGVVALLAVLRAGGCYLPLDPAYPPERLGFMLADAAAPVIVTRDRLAAALPPHAARVLSLDAGWPEPARGGELPEVGPEHLAYAIYTSGSTGRPKGVALPHRTLANLIAWQIGASAAPAGRTLQFASASFDVSLQEILATWAAGGTLVLLAEEARSDAEALLCRLIDARVERLFLPFVALQQLAEAAASSAGALPPLKEVLTAGEQLQVTAEVRALFARLPGCVLRNQYGPSEAHVVTELALWNERPGAVEEWPALPPIGRPIAATEAHLLDPRGAPVPIGVPGEICLGGAGLARGYLGRPDQTAERFVPDPWGRGGRLYRTGDLARRRASGEIEFLGRIDHQVKIRGFRIELGEIEAALSTHPAAREAVVVARGEGAGRRLVAYIVPATEGHPGDLLRAHLLARLPDYMVPTAFVPVEALPLTASGKVDRKALAASGPEARGTAARGDAARTPTEELLAGIWAEVLGVERVGIHDGFFDLGGHSLLATRLVARLRGAFGVELPLRALFERPSVAELARLLDSLTRQSHGLAAPPLERVSGSLEPSLSFAQQSLWLIDQIEGGSATYNMLATLELAGRLDTAALAGSFEDVVERHAVLRTSFALRGGEPRQVIHSHLEVPLLLADLSALPASRREEALGAVHRQMRHPFDLAKAPLLRTVLLRLVPDLHVLALCQHHIVSDAWSIGILVREMAACYEARTRGARAALPPLPVQYADYADWQRRWLRGEALEKLLAFWHRQLGTEPPAARLPALRPAPAARTSRGGRRTFPLTAGLEPALRALARREGVTLFMLLLGAFQALLHRSTGQEDLVLVAAASRRDRLETEGLIGCFLNMLPLRASLTGDLSFRRLLKRVRETCLDAFAHQDMPFERLVAELRLHNQNGRSPFQVAFGMQSAPPPLPEIPALAVRLLESDSGAARLDLTLWVTEHPEGLSVSWTYSADLFDGEEMVRLHGLYEALLTAVAMNPDARLRDLALPAAPERESGPAPRQRWEDLKKRKLKEARERSVRG